MRGLSSVVLAFVCVAFVAVECLAVNACPEHSWLERWDHSCACRNEKWQPVSEAGWYEYERLDSSTCARSRFLSCMGVMRHLIEVFARYLRSHEHTLEYVAD